VIDVDVDVAVFVFGVMVAFVFVFEVNADLRFSEKRFISELGFSLLVLEGVCFEASFFGVIRKLDSFSFCSSSCFFWVIWGVLLFLNF
jgi:hypothetical protein